MFQIFVEVFASIVERLTTFLQAADEKRAFEGSDDDLRGFLRVNRGIDLTICDASEERAEWESDLGVRSIMSSVTATKSIDKWTTTGEMIVYYNQRDRHESGRRTMAV